MSDQTEGYREGFRERVQGAPVVTVQTASQCTFLPFTALPAAYAGRRVALVLLDAGDTDYANEKARIASAG
ncbi:hypothetical protein [Rhodanobacter lindaniclasticus]|uniref:Uncharacterized protein n=1 Tax=Rhodanobacter lindaniclasticus TaxID=75310 RepID=A0A4S3K6E0_9GAMM|nr:hypothetical protein [Rhodanobacter lindaniclasticus]THD03725.1 hypothetical protein B1991_18270 [Rhodanobacter lindaniclasticus]